MTTEHHIEAVRDLLVLIAKRQRQVVERLQDDKETDRLAHTGRVFEALCRVADALEVGLTLEPHNAYFDQAMNETTQRIIECAHFIEGLKRVRAKREADAANKKVTVARTHTVTIH